MGGPSYKTSKRFATGKVKRAEESYSDNPDANHTQFLDVLPLTSSHEKIPRDQSPAVA